MVAAALMIALLVTNPGSVLAQQDCEPQINQDDTVPGEDFDLTFDFGSNCAAPDQEIVIVLHEDIGVPFGFDEDDVVIFANGRYYPTFVDLGESGDDTEIVLPPCAGWRQRGDDDFRLDCPKVILDAIRLEGLDLPDTPADEGDEYEVSIQWGNIGPFSDSIGVDAALEIDGDNEVGYGETVEIQGLGFTEGLSVELFAKDATAPEGCGNAGGSGWATVGTATVGSNSRFEIDVEIGSNLFRNAGAYEICAVDGAGVRSRGSLRIVVTAGLEIVGSSEVSPGDQVTLKFIGGSGGGVTAFRLRDGRPTGAAPEAT